MCVRRVDRYSTIVWHRAGDNAPDYLAVSDLLERGRAQSAVLRKASRNAVSSWRSSTRRSRTSGTSSSRGRARA